MQFRKTLISVLYVCVMDHHELIREAEGLVKQRMSCYNSSHESIKLII